MGEQWIKPTYIATFNEFRPISGLYPSSELESDIVLGGQNLKSLQRQFWVNINLPKFILTLPSGPVSKTTLLTW